MYKPQRVDGSRRCVTDVRIEVHVPADETDRILGDESLEVRVVVPRSEYFSLVPSSSRPV